MHGVGSRNKLTPWHARFYPDSSVLDRLGRAICAVGCLPRKELHEAWEMATLVRTRFRGGRVVDLCSGYGLLAQMMVLLDDSSTEALAVDVKLPPNHVVVRDAIADAFPLLRQRVRFVAARLDTVVVYASDVVVSAHACGSLTDDVLARAGEAGARVAVLPCCHAYRYRADLVDEPDPALAMDRQRAERLSMLGYRVWSSSIPEAVSAKNRLLLAAPTAPTDVVRAPV